MYLSFFGLSEKPFAITPDPRYLYLSERHAEALAHLLYGINESGGFIQLTGEVGTGKTTVVRSLLSRVPHHADVAVILNPRLTPVEFLQTICEELGCADRGCRPRKREAHGGCAESAALDGARRGPPGHRHRRRGAESVAGNLGASAPPHQPRDADAEAAADHPDRTAGAARSPGSQRPAAARAAHHRALSPDAAVARGDPGLRPPSPQGRRRRG